MSNNEELKKRLELEKTLISEAWSNPNFRDQLVNNPKKVFSEILGTEIPDTLEINVVEESSNSFTLVIPESPLAEEASEELTDEALEAVAGGGDWVITQKSSLLTNRFNTLDPGLLSTRITKIGNIGF